MLCGKKRLATKQNLQRNEVKDCGNHRDYKDIKNKRFGKLVAVYVTDQKAIQKADVKYGIVNAIAAMNVMYIMMI